MLRRRAIVEVFEPSCWMCRLGRRQLSNATKFYLEGVNRIVQSVAMHLALDLLE